MGIYIAAFIGAVAGVPVAALIIDFYQTAKAHTLQNEFNKGYRLAIEDLETRNQYWSDAEQVWIDAKFKKNLNIK